MNGTIVINKTRHGQMKSIQILSLKMLATFCAAIKQASNMLNIIDDCLTERKKLQLLLR